MPDPVNLLPVISVPPCQYRQGLGRYKCGCGHPSINRVVTLEECQSCEFRSSPESRVQSRESRADSRQPTANSPPPCLHLGHELRREPCSCPAYRDGIPVFACALHGECVLSRNERERVRSGEVKIHTCETCRDFIDDRLKPVEYAYTPELAIVTSHFNSCGHQILRDNYWRWKESLGPLSANLTSVELSFDGEFHTDSRIQIDGGPENVMFQKEALLNIAFRQLPDHYRYVAWIDHDVLFIDPDWAVKTVELLRDNHAAVQLFDWIWDLNRDGRRITNHWIGSVHKRGRGNPGTAWAARRDYLDDIGGLCDTMISGGGDVPCAAGLADIDWQHYYTEISPALRADNRRWVERARAARGDLDYGCLAGPVLHLYHGNRHNRQYKRRTRMLATFVPNRDLRRNTDGIWEWANADLQRQVSDYFVSRREDQ